MQSLLVSHQFRDDSQIIALAVIKRLLADRLCSKTLGLTVKTQADKQRGESVSNQSINKNINK